MTEARPDPDQLLERLKKEDEEAGRGKLKIFFGASAGVGKTYAMLLAARSAREQGTDVLMGVIETHGRIETEALVEGIERLPLKAIAYRDRELKEFDLDGALARHPQLVLIDELAHSNAPGSRHPKRWQDVEELLDAGIDVWSTMNVQHLDSLNDVVSGITGIRVWETVPDRVFDETDEVVIVDLPPDELLRRLKEGKVYLPQQAERAVRNFFRKGNLIALRELALRRTADRVDSEMLQYRGQLAKAPVWQTREALLLCIGPDERSGKLIRSTARLAAQLDVRWHCVYVETPQLQRLPESVRQQIFRQLKLAQDAGAVSATLTGGQLAATLVKYARQHNLSRVVLGRDTARKPRPWRRELAAAVGALGAELDILQIALPARDSMERRHGRSNAVTPSEQAVAWPWRSYAWSAAICGVAALLAAPLHSVFELANIVMIFLLAVVVAALRFGRGPAVLAAFLSVGAFDFFFVAPRFTFNVGDAQYLLTFIVMLAVALIIGQLTAGLKFQARVATQREERVSALYAMSRDLSAALLPEQISEIAARFLKSEFGARAAVMLADPDGQVGLPAAPPDMPAALDAGIAQWAFAHSEAAGFGTHTLPGSPVLYLPLKAPMCNRGVLAIEPGDASRIAGPEQRRLLETCASLLAISLERIHYVDVARSSTVQMESERLRNSLLAAISHDLRTPLSSLIGMAESLSFQEPPPRTAQKEVIDRMRDAALRMNSLVTNLLDMARLQSGQIRLNLQWLPLEEVVGSALKAMGSLLDPQRVRVVLPEDLPLLQVDAVLIERVLCNLLENALKYTPAGAQIEIGAIAGAPHVIVRVDDHGPGLPKGREEAIFQKFERGQKESATAGVGLGLAICRAIVEAHGGRISGETLEQGGARFSFTLPRGTPPKLQEIDALPSSPDEKP